MLARCDACQKPFVTPRMGAQPCPRCGAGVVVDAPPGMDSSASQRPEAAVPAQASMEPVRVLPVAGRGFWPLWWGMLTSPRTVQLDGSLTAQRAMRFGYFCALWGLLGSALKDALADATVQESVLASATPQARCVLEQAVAFEEQVRPWTMARLPLAPFLALLCTYGLLHFFHLAVTAMGRTGVDFPDAARSVAPCLAPLALAALPMMGLGLCLAWSMVLATSAVQRTYRLSRPLAGAVASLPVLCYAAWELLLQLHVARPCFNLG